RRARRGMAHFHSSSASDRGRADRTHALRIRVAWSQGRRGVPYRARWVQAHGKGVSLGAKERSCRQAL
ncbi:hypothetical protein LPJ57_009972, partial [Coemansia sp. RSA 486]